MVTKHAEETNQQENMRLPEENIQRQNQQKQHIMPILHEYCHLHRFQDRTEGQSRASLGRNLNVA
jgi:hypothetical protein